ncbi:Coenzyme F420 hydrogenase/dehydrogenase, beta subunit C-terminal domain [Natronoflexus pectinivorans]|uniref:Coenzyme F420 hydrogenase subunit beta n=1 Tax=Natronoflexus pectinivorans TaxID=682526 RepID=A0A4V2RWD2_9BACT|nr:Coenzyme F420 hydrogenase/dehydrogenase, beta subunit C-terminal domain [Natronoflexus pectinivorans]TCO07874.1 coenzyme F420 hydrogenase subunit beta [Natronoflexus pectinivorans]
MRSIERIVRRDLCIGCGLCETVFGQENLTMQLQSNGFLEPTIQNHKIYEEKIISRICPGVNIVNDQPFVRHERIWGKVIESYSGYSEDKEIRTKGSSGGIISAVAIYLLENSIVDTVLQVGGNSKDFRRNSLKESKTREDVLSCATSRYAPAAVFRNILDILRASSDSFLLIGKPCDISGIKNLLNEYPEYKERFKFFVSIVCAGIPSFNATQDVIASFKNVKYPVTELAYRGNGWPGYFSFLDASGHRHQMSYNDSWGKKLGKKIHFRCKICPDGIGLQADMAVGDAWETKDGYPDFTERDGQSLILIRTTKALELLRKMQKDECVTINSLPVEKLKSIQPFQYVRRRAVGARVMAVYIAKGVLLNFKGVRLWNNLLSQSLKSIIREFGGTIKRILLKHEK